MELKKKLLETRNITLDAVLEKARAFEAAKQQMQCMMAGTSVNAIGKREGKGWGPVRKNMFQLWEEGIFHSGFVLSSKRKKVCCRVLKTRTFFFLLQRKSFFVRKW